MPSLDRQNLACAIVGVIIGAVVSRYISQPGSEVPKRPFAIEASSNKDWRASQAQVEARLAKVKPQYRERCENVLRGRPEPGFSQAWQDWILWRNFHSSFGRGLYVDLGTNHPIIISNTAFFDVCLGWDGVCFEPQEQYHGLIRRHRSCKLVPKCVLGEAGGVSVQRGGGSGLMFKKARGGRKDRQCVGFLEQLDALGLQGRTIDLLSIDIEGLESDVLSCMPWHSVKVNFVLIETNKHDLKLVDAYFSYHGFVNAATLLGPPMRAPWQLSWLDHLYTRLPGGPLVRPTADVVGAKLQCSAAQRSENPWSCTKRLPSYYTHNESRLAGWICPRKYTPVAAPGPNGE